MNRFFAFALLAVPSLYAQKAGAENGVTSILQVKRIYVSPLTGGAEASALRELIIASLNGTRLFVLTENEERADAVLKGAADDQAFTDTYDSSESVSGHENISKGNGASAKLSRASGIALGNGAAEGESHHIKERKHEAYATVRLCNKDGDVLWSTTQESLGAKFRGASADVAARIAHQFQVDYERERRSSESTGGTMAPAPVAPAK